MKAAGAAKRKSMEITKGDKWRQEQPRAGQNGDHAGRQIKAGAAKSRPEWRSQRETNEGGHINMKAGEAQSRPELEITKGDKWRETNQGQEQARMEIMQGDKWREWRSRRETNEGKQMKAGAAKSRPEWRSRRETNEGRQMKAGAAKSRPEWRSCRKTNEGRQVKAGAAKSRPEWRSQTKTNEGRLGGSGRDFGDQQPNLWEVKTPIASSYPGKKSSFFCCNTYCCFLTLFPLENFLLLVELAY